MGAGWAKQVSRRPLPGGICDPSQAARRAPAHVGISTRVQGRVKQASRRPLPGGICDPAQAARLAPAHVGISTRVQGRAKQVTYCPLPGDISAPAHEATVAYRHRKRKHAPCPGVLCTSICMPWRRAISRAMASPSPLPCRFSCVRARWKRSKMACTSSGGMPGP